MGRLRLRRGARRFYVWNHVQIPRFLSGKIPDHVYFLAMRYRWLITYGVLSYKWMLLW